MKSVVPCVGAIVMPRRLSGPARRAWRFGKALASTGAERTQGREHPKRREDEAKPQERRAGCTLKISGMKL